MKLARKGQYQPVYPERPKEYRADGNLSQSQKDLFRVDMRNPIPYGKYKDQNLQWVKEHDNKYYQWVLDNDMQYIWCLIVLRENSVMQKPKKVNQWDPHIVQSNGECWMGLRYIDEPSIPYNDIDNT